MLIRMDCFACRQTGWTKRWILALFPSRWSRDLRSGHCIPADRRDHRLCHLLPKDEANPQDIRDLQREQSVQKCSLTREPLLHKPLQSKAILEDKTRTGTTGVLGTRRRQRQQRHKRKDCGRQKRFRAGKKGRIRLCTPFLSPVVHHLCLRTNPLMPSPHASLTQSRPCIQISLSKEGEKTSKSPAVTRS